MTDVVPARVRIDLSPPQVVTQTSGLLFEPARDEQRTAVALAPGAGTDLLHPVLLEVGKGLAAAGHPTLLFNFAFTEAGRRRPDPLPRLEHAYADVVTWLRGKYGQDRSVVLGGRSLGGRIASRLVADPSPEEAIECAGLVLLGYPLHTRQRRDAGSDHLRLRTEHWPDLRTPTLFVQGDRDALCDLSLLARERTDHLSHIDSQVHVVHGGDHAFAVRARDARSPAEVLTEVRDAVVAWMQDHERSGFASALGA